MNLNIKLCTLTLLSFTFFVQLCYISALTRDEFNKAVTSNGYPVPEDEVYRYFEDNTGNFSREEAAMFIAQLIHESGGFRYTEQQACLKSSYCRGRYIDDVGLPGKRYHGRGYIQLTWAENYKVASEGLNMGDRLLKHPEDVANNKKIAMLVSVWYWNARVKPFLEGNENLFGITTKGINPDECARASAIASFRYRIYLRVASALNITNKAKENGCYN